MLKEKNSWLLLSALCKKAVALTGESEVLINSDGYEVDAFDQVRRSTSAPQPGIVLL
jgi:hypothetical protein